MEFSDVENLNFKKLSKVLKFLPASFLLFALVNLLSSLRPNVLQQLIAGAPLIGIENILLIFSCVFAAQGFKKASSCYTLIVETQNNDLSLLTSAGQQMQKAITWSSIVLAIILVRSIQFHATFDLMPK